MVFKYIFGGDDYESGDDFEFEVENTDAIDKLKMIFIRRAKVKKHNEDTSNLLDTLITVIDDLDMTDDILEYFEEELAQEFERDAYESFLEFKNSN